MKQVLSKLTSIPNYSRHGGLVGLALAVCVAFGWAPFRDGAPTIRVLAAPGPEAEILSFIRDRHPELGLDVIVGSGDYVSALTRGDVDVASVDTHVAFREHVRTTGADLVSLGETVTKPLGFYTSAGASAHFTPGTSVVLPSERQTQARALLLLYSSGYATFSSEVDTDLSLSELSGNPKDLSFSALPAQERAGRLQAPGPVLVALEYDEARRLGLQPARDAKLMEDGFSPFANVLVAREGDQHAPWLGSLLRAYHDTDVKSFILRSYNDSVRRPW